MLLHRYTPSHGLFNVEKMIFQYKNEEMRNFHPWTGNTVYNVIRSNDNSQTTFTTFKLNFWWDGWKLIQLYLLLYWKILSYPFVLHDKSLLFVTLLLYYNASHCACVVLPTLHVPQHREDWHDWKHRSINGWHQSSYLLQIPALHYYLLHCQLSPKPLYSTSHFHLFAPCTSNALEE